MMVINGDFSTGNFDKCIKTEQLIFFQLEVRKAFISDEFELFPYSLAVLLNERGSYHTNDFIDRCKSQRRRIFVCQHIWVDQLRFQESDLIFSPHSTRGGFHISIPHQSVNYDLSLRSTVKEIDFSFVGNLGAHQVRKNLALSFPDKVKDSGVGWGLDLSTPLQAKSNYVRLLSSSHFSLCPRGTGISSVRLFESLAMGSIPIIVADNYLPPLAEFLNWDDFSISVPEDSIQEIPNLVGNLLKDKKKLKKMRQTGMSVYDTYFSNENLYKTVEINLAHNV
jgi:glycosyltransferase involved in cell wall biosynthesis